MHNARDFRGKHETYYCNVYQVRIEVAMMPTCRYAAVGVQAGRCRHPETITCLLEQIQLVVVHTIVYPSVSPTHRQQYVHGGSETTQLTYMYTHSHTHILTHMHSHTHTHTHTHTRMHSPDIHRHQTHSREQYMK